MRIATWVLVAAAIVGASVVSALPHFLPGYGVDTGGYGGGLGSGMRSGFPGFGNGLGGGDAGDDNSSDIKELGGDSDSPRPKGAGTSTLSKDPSGCGVYTIISTRGTGELQGPSAGFRTMIANTLSQVRGGVEYDTAYPADFSQVSTRGTQDILRKIKSKLAQCPNHKFALLGYSQGAAATTEALNEINDDATFKAVRAVVLIGNSRRVPGKKSDVDSNGGQATRAARGLQAFQGGISDRWDQSGKVLDICAALDGVCDASTGTGISMAHITAYGGGNWVQNAGTKLMVSGFSR